MKKLSAICLFILMSTCSHTQTPSWLWAKSAGGDSEDKSLSIASDNSGKLYVTGYSSSPTINFDSSIFLTNSGKNMFLAKYDESGNVIWAKGTTGNFANAGNSVATDNAGNIYVAGNFFAFGGPTLTFDAITLTHPGMFLVKYDAAGNVIWAKDALNQGSNATAVAVDNLGNIFVGGNLGDTLIIGPDTLLASNYHRFVAKFDTAGNPIWARGLETGGNTINVDEPFISADKFGNLYITGGFHNSICVIVTTVLVNQGDDNIYLAKFNGSGNLLWAKRYGASGQDDATSVDTDTSGNIYITGFFTSNNITFDSFTLSGNGYTAFVIKLDTGGTAIWAEKFGRLDYPAPPKIAANSNEGVFVVGLFNSPALVFTSSDSLVNPGLFLAKYDTNGNFKWARDAIGGSWATGVSIDSTGNPYITGYFNDDPFIFDATVLHDTTSSLDIFVAAINSVVSVEEINSPAENTISVFPNPSRGKFFILTTRSEPCTVVIYDMMGKEVVSNITAGGIQQINLLAQPQGIYFVTITTEKNKFSRKIVIQ